jgi:hypothetical protein
MPVPRPIIATAAATPLEYDPRHAREDARLARWCALAAVAWGIAAAWYYASIDLTLSHYDAKAHLVVARRVIDSITPGWQQIGAVWLPLPHVLNLLPVQVDALYRTGASGVAISILSLALGGYALVRMIARETGSSVGAVTALVLLLSNPNLLYLQSTPMTEPLLIGLLIASTMCLHAFVREPAARWRHRAGWSLAGACLTRYESWPFLGAALALTLLARWRSGARLRTAAADVAWIAIYPAAAIVWFLVHSKVTIGAWFVTGGFYVPDPLLEGRLGAVTTAVWWGAEQLGSTLLMTVALVAAGALAWRALRHPAHASGLVPLALLAVAALPWYAFYEGHPFRIRYMIPLVAAAAVLNGLGIGLLARRKRPLAATALIAAVLSSARPFDPKAAMVLEAQWDHPNSVARGSVTRCLAGRYHGETVMASMGSLAHYMQELSHAGFSLRDFLHEGNGDIWLSALGGASRYVGWVLIEERAEGGDMLKQRAAEHPEFLNGFTRVCEGGGVALYRRGNAGLAD